jgi:hypothetical protein
MPAISKISRNCPIFPTFHVNLLRFSARLIRRVSLIYREEPITQNGSNIHVSNFSARGNCFLARALRVFPYTNPEGQEMVSPRRALIPPRSRPRPCRHGETSGGCRNAYRHLFLTQPPGESGPSIRRTIVLLGGTIASIASSFSVGSART